MPRVVSLIASATEIVCALGARDSLVGRSHECDYPISVTALPICTEATIAITGSSIEIDRLVKDRLRDAISVYRVLTDVLDTLAPDVILTQAHCEVCAVSLRDVELALGTMVQSQPKVVSLEPNALADVFTGIRQIAVALEIPESGELLIAQIQERIATVRRRAARLEDRPTVACIEWIEPLMSAGNWTPELVECAGGKPLFAVAGQHSPWLTWDMLEQHDPDVIIVMPCGFDLERTRHEFATLTNHPIWPTLRAVRERRVYLADGNAFFNRPGPRLIDSLEMLAEAIHPSAFAFGHAGIVEA